mmetsp:Transcript_93174/g.301251  ORF Transcript_93174/g.301251 Transcript_93174/m.301251 type:complete len:347 (+) Transcript_93174:64-1104(+)
MPPRKSRSSSKKPEGEGVAGGFQAVVSLGSICLTARFLESHGVRKQKFPFDWIYSSARLVRHCLADDFRQFLNEGQLQTWRTKRGTGHKLYEKMQLGKRTAVWPHHSLKKEVDLESFKRAVERLKTLVTDKRKKLFVLVQSITSKAMLDVVREQGPSKLPKEPKVPVPSEPSSDQGSILEVRRLFHDLKEYSVGNFHFDVVNLLQPGVSEAKRSPELRKVYTEDGSASCRGSCASTLAVYDLHCTGGNTGLFFKDERDRKALAKLLIEAAGEGAAKTGDLVRARDLDLEHKLEIVWENPKAVGSKAHQRYQRYRRAMTVGEFFKLGGLGGDLRNDTSHGFIKLLGR